MQTAAQRAKKLFVTNPMKMEVVRFKSRFVNCTSNPAFNKALVALVVVGYLCIVGMLFAVREDLHPGGVIIAQAVLTLLGVAMAGHGAIAAERDRRSWDLLQVAPITQEEIVVGKFLGLMALVVALTAAFLPILLIAAAFYHETFGHFRPPSIPNILAGEGIALSFAAATGAFTIYLSARLRNANAALGTVVASLVGLLVVVPICLITFTELETQSHALDVLLVWHPIWAIFRILWPNDANEFLPQMSLLYGLPQIVLYLLTTWFFTTAASSLLKKRAKE
jgi:ABC-type transport system involved in multi-copper enzyme maturation permease subunit